MNCAPCAVLYILWQYINIFSIIVGIRYYISFRWIVQWLGVYIIYAGIPLPHKSSAHLTRYIFLVFTMCSHLPHLCVTSPWLFCDYPLVHTSSLAFLTHPPQPSSHLATIKQGLILESYKQKLSPLMKIRWEKKKGKRGKTNRAWKIPQTQPPCLVHVLTPPGGLPLHCSHVLRCLHARSWAAAKTVVPLASGASPCGRCVTWACKSPPSCWGSRALEFSSKLLLAGFWCVKEQSKTCLFFHLRCFAKL